MQMKEVESSGLGVTLNGAINNALEEAIGRVNGKSIETKSMMQSIEISETDNQNEDYYASEAYMSKIKTATKGVVSSYDLVSKVQNSDGLWEVSLYAKITKYVAPNNNRKRIAVMPLRTSKRNFTVRGSALDKSLAARLVGQGIASSLVQARRFTVLDREYIAETVGEKELIRTGDVPTVEMARLGQELAADYIFVGTVEDLGFKEEKIKMQVSGRELTKRTGSVEIAYRLIDVATRQIAVSDTLRLSLSEQDLRNASSGSIGENPEIAITSVAGDAIGKAVLNIIYPVVVVSVSGDNLTLGQGGSQLKQGEHLDVFKYGEKLYDPYTKEFIGRKETFAATIKITRVNPKTSQARVVNAAIDLNKKFEPKMFICRVSQNAPKSSTEIKKEERKKERKKRAKKRDDDW